MNDIKFLNAEPEPISKVPKLACDECRDGHCITTTAMAKLEFLRELVKEANIIIDAYSIVLDEDKEEMLCADCGNNMNKTHDKDCEIGQWLTKYKAMMK